MERKTIGVHYLENQGKFLENALCEFIHFISSFDCELLCRSLRDTQNIMFRFYRQIFSLLLFNTAPIYSTDGNGMYFLFWFSLIIFRSRYNTDNV
jgi:hypothetical protein